MSIKATIKAIATHLPEKRLTNEDLARDYQDWDAKRVYSKTGILERAIAGPGECASDLGYRAVEKLFSGGYCDRSSIDFLLLCTQSPDYFLPATACVLQERLGLPKSCGAIDINQGCSGFVYGLALAKGLIETQSASNILLITAETYSKYMGISDRSTRALFSDGAAATLVSAVDSEKVLIGDFIMGTDGSGAERLIVRDGGHRHPNKQARADRMLNEVQGEDAWRHLYMDGPEIFNFALNVIPRLVEGLLSKARLAQEDIDLFVFHQANRFMLEQLRRKLHIPREKFIINMEYYGNTISSTIPMALEIAEKQGLIKAGSRLMLVGFGVGLSWAGTVIQWSRSGG